MAEEEKTEEETQPDFKEGEFDEHTSYSFLFFLIAGATLFVTLWAFWDDEYARRGYKSYQEAFFKEQYAVAETEWKNINTEIASTEQQIADNINQKTDELEADDNYIDLVEEVRLKQIALDEEKEKKKFAGSRVDEAYYYYKKAMHEGENYDVEKATLHSLEDKVKAFDPIIGTKQKILAEAENRLLKVKAEQIKLEEDLGDLTRKKDQLELTMDYYKPFPFFWRPAEVLQTVIPGFGVNAFKEIIYRVCLLYTSPSPRDRQKSRMPSSA